ncbi:hypothetical protein BJV78DRAFT_1355285 [Lactifluus subvellereus]|nr:hypothetical protein BJV78DRAFT_1355285 [Lactifluus subvellereus]
MKVSGQKNLRDCDQTRLSHQLVTDACVGVSTWRGHETQWLDQRRTPRALTVTGLGRNGRRIGQCSCGTRPGVLYSTAGLACVRRVIVQGKNRVPQLEGGKGVPPSTVIAFGRPDGTCARREGGYARGPRHLRPRTRRRQRRRWLAGCVPADSDTNKPCHAIPLEVAGAFWAATAYCMVSPITSTSLLFLGFRRDS